ncbi:Mitochondrial import receptor subunit tom20 [Grifola frondosa]|uniref:Mitochondrial import receptor subunit tom20 n=1 Tax=Grifola frondosa TaxID=5627 RepID=A0A1C7MK52_GRIFR|nr:Mitochondrial import receptor subunit tom20 [Grifola frondosa]
MSRSSTIFTVATVTVLSGLVAYAVYFDYKRRNDTAFRKQLRTSTSCLSIPRAPVADTEIAPAGKEKKRVDKRVAEHVAAHAISQEEIRAALLKVRDEELPPTSEERETYFLDQVAVGEQLCSRGPEFHLPAALTFFRALRVYPSPVELIMIYQKTVPEPVFKLVMELTNLDVSSPPKPADLDTSQLDVVMDEDETSPTRSEPRSETSSQEWDRLTDPGSHFGGAP